ncbi:tetratricopeptide repeat protein [Dinghuibacter silviterrae]|uniref:YaiO family outer membrane protein n=1 Tax=Dinghuibacter silviterrae TaxID=1539049 RepID=A0A4V6Q9W4_9BACT|nr:tetratricopeptide repeat protein [Dinghuibacter silviterrae]TDW97552.1 YaiO family outer membrane protein [Dinghuibacter silviterrae]
MRIVHVVFFLCCATGALAQTHRSSSELAQAARDAMAQGKYPEALDLAHRATLKSLGDLDVQFVLGRAYLLNHYPDSAWQVLKAIVDKDPKYRDAYLLLANIELERHNPGEALCYIDDGLYNYPDDKEFALKKFSILQTMRNPALADEQGQALLDRYNQDTGVLRTYIAYKIESAQRYTKLKDFTRAAYEYRKVLEVDPVNAEALQGIYGLQVRTGSYEDALSSVNSALVEHPDDYSLLMRKMSLLQELKRYPEAIEVLQHILKVYPADAKARQLDVDLRMEAGRYFMSEDPYLQFQAVLDKSPSNREALDYVINLASARGLNADALAFVNRALHYYPGDRALLAKKVSILESLQKYTQAADITRQLFLGPGGSLYRDQYITLLEASGRAYMSDLAYDSALATFHDVLEISPAEPAALNYSINILSAQKNYGAAIALLDKTLRLYPGDEALLLKKAGILQDDTRYGDAALVLDTLVQAHPENTRYRSSLVDLILVQGRQMMQVEDYDAADGAFTRVLALDPGNTEALGTLINIELARGVVDPGPLDSALIVADLALSRYPDSRDFLLKKASVLEALHRYPEAYAITDALRDRYPYNAKIRDQYIDELLSSGRAYSSQGQPELALGEYRRVLAVRPRDSAALMYAINILNDRGTAAASAPADTASLDSALALTAQGLRFYPGNEYFTLKRAVILENLHRYADAVAPADSVAKIDPTDAHRDYADYLRSKTFRNALGLSYLSSHFDSLEAANIATLHYVRYSKNGSSFDTKLNFAGRAIGTGLQLEEEIYYTHNDRWDSYIDAALANDNVFPRIRLAYSITYNFKGGWAGELGGRYLNLDSISVYSGVASVTKYFGDFYINARGYLIFAPGKMYEAGVLTARQYLNNKTDFLYGALGIGNSPDEFSRNYQLGQNLGSQTYSIGAGYQKTFAYRNVVNLSGTWYSQRLAPGRYRNQYDLMLSYLRKF